MIIRDFTAHDVAPASRLTNYYIEHTAVHFGMHPYTPEEFGAIWTGSRSVYPWLAADIDGIFAGYAKGSRWREREAYAKTVEVGLYVDAAFHRRGVGRALYTELLARLKAQGFHTAVGGVSLPNEGSVRLHESMGFRKVGEFKQVGHKFGQWHDTGFWQILL